MQPVAAAEASTAAAAAAAAADGAARRSTAQAAQRGGGGVPAGFWERHAAHVVARRAGGHSLCQCPTPHRAYLGPVGGSSSDARWCRHCVPQKERDEGIIVVLKNGCLCGRSERTYGPAGGKRSDALYCSICKAHAPPGVDIVEYSWARKRKGAAEARAAGRRRRVGPQGMSVPRGQLPVQMGHGNALHVPFAPAQRLGETPAPAAAASDSNMATIPSHPPPMMHASSSVLGQVTVPAVAIPERDMMGPHSPPGAAASRSTITAFVAADGDGVAPGDAAGLRKRSGRGAQGRASGSATRRGKGKGKGASGSRSHATCFCGRARPTFGIVGTSVPRFCSSCRKTAGEPTEDVANKHRCACGQAVPSFGLAGGTAKDARWCAACKSDAGQPVVDVVNSKCACGKAQPKFGPVGGRPKDARWCKACRETAGMPTVNVSQKLCKCGRCRPVYGPVGSRPKDALYCRACRSQCSEATENVVRKRTLETQRRKDALRTAKDGKDAVVGGSPPHAVVPDASSGAPAGDRVIMTTMSGSEML